MIRIEIDSFDLLGCHNDVEVNMTVCAKLKEAGVPILDGPLLPQVDFSQGVITTFEEPETLKRVYIWKPK